MHLLGMMKDNENKRIFSIIEVKVCRPEKKILSGLAFEEKLFYVYEYSARVSLSSVNWKMY